METLESVELLYDGYDWLVVNTQKQQYVQATPINYLLYGTNGTAGSFKNRDINNLLYKNSIIYIIDIIINGRKVLFNEFVHMEFVKKIISSKENTCRRNN